MWYYNTSMIIDLINRVKGVDKLEVVGGEKMAKDIKLCLMEEDDREQFYFG